jgi:uncharacterized membrane protein
MKTSLADFDFLDPTTFIITCIAMFFVVMIRYFILSGFFHSYFYLWKKEEWKLRKINTKAYPPEQFKKEITWSTLTAVLFLLLEHLRRYSGKKAIPNYIQTCTGMI